MTATEFKAWFEGYCEAIGDNAVPSPDQWAKIKERVKRLNTSVVATPRTPPHWGLSGAGMLNPERDR